MGHGALLVHDTSSLATRSGEGVGRQSVPRLEISNAAVHGEIAEVDRDVSGEHLPRGCALGERQRRPRAVAEPLRFDALRIQTLEVLWKQLPEHFVGGWRTRLRSASEAGSITDPAASATAISNREVRDIMMSSKRAYRFHDKTCTQPNRRVHQADSAQTRPDHGRTRAI